MGSVRGMPSRNTPADFGCLTVREEPKLEGFGVACSEVGVGLRFMDVPKALFRFGINEGGCGAVGTVAKLANGFPGTGNG